MAELNIVRQRAEQRNSLSDEHRNTSDNKPLNQASAHESLNSHPTVDIDITCAGGGELGGNLSGRSSHLLDSSLFYRREIECRLLRTTTRLLP
jgi:hypothetical protein